MEIWNKILYRLFDVPGVVLIQGAGKCGKTDFGLKIAEDLSKMAIFPSRPNEPLIMKEAIASNIDTKNFYPQIYDLISLKDWLYADTRRKVYIFDEANQWLSNLRTMSSSNVAFTTLLPQVTKGHARMIVIGHDFTGVDINVSRAAWCKGIFTKTSLKTALLTSNLFHQPIEFDNISRTSVPFDPYAVAPFQERPTNVLRFKDVEKEVLWKWSNGSTIQELNLHKMQLNRLVRKYVRQTLENDFHVSHP